MRTQLDEMARTIVGDGKSPNLYFVSEKGLVVLVERSYLKARKRWEQLPRNVETCMEDRLTGVIASNEPDEDGSKRLVVIEDFDTFERHHPSLAKS